MEPRWRSRFFSSVTLKGKEALYQLSERELPTRSTLERLRLKETAWLQKFSYPDHLSGLPPLPPSGSTLRPSWGSPSACGRVDAWFRSWQLRAFVTFARLSLKRYRRATPVVTQKPSTATALALLVAPFSDLGEQHPSRELRNQAFPAASQYTKKSPPN